MDEYKEFKDRTLVCADCGTDFMWAAEEQELFSARGFNDPPRRCPECRRARRARNAEGWLDGGAG